MKESSVDSIVTDPPYGLSFMGKNWDHGVPGVPFWTEALRVLKPGGHLLAFGGSRTYHRLACAIEDAGFEIRDQIQWIYGSGFPKSMDVSKAIDKAAGAERTEILGPKAGHENFVGRDNMKSLREGTMSQEGGFARPWMSDPEAVERAHHSYAPATDSARQWSGWGTALKPAHEPIVMARKPLGESTVAANVLAHGTGAINVDGCRVVIDPKVDDPRLGGKGDWSSDKMAKNVYEGGYAGERVGSSPLGRWPANVIHDGSEEVVSLFPRTGPSNVRPPTGKPLFATSGRAVEWNANSVMDTVERGVNDNGGSAARFFYCAKASKSDRGEGNNHPTVKPCDLMRYLCRLVTPPGGVVLDPFAGSGSTGKAAALEGFHFVGIEKDEKYCKIAESRSNAS